MKETNYGGWSSDGTASAMAGLRPPEARDPEAREPEARGAAWTTIDGGGR